MTRVQPAQAPAPIQRLLAVCRFERFRPKQVILQQGAASKDVYYVLKGSLSVEAYDEDGRRLVLDYIGPGEFFGEMGLFEDQPKRSATVLARGECEVAVVELARFRSLVAEDHELLMELTRQLAIRLRKTSEKLGNLAFLDVTGRIARALIQLADDEQAMSHPDGKLVRITREELGQIVNCSREVAGHVLRILEEDGLIRLEGRSIVVYPFEAGRSSGN